MSLTVCVFANPPVPGAAKTRLIPAVGAHGAAALARAMLLDTLAMARSLDDALVVLATGAPMPADLPLPGDLPCWAQGQGDLGQRMEGVLRQALQRGPALLIGTDLPGLPPRHLDQARHALHSADAVLGPAEDGGFYLIGCSRLPPAAVLSGLPWSQASTFEATRQQLVQRGLKTTVIDPWFDLDVPEDLRRVRAKLAASEIHAPHLNKVLST